VREISKLISQVQQQEQLYLPEQELVLVPELVQELASS
jgi:hypothetical protein